MPRSSPRRALVAVFCFSLLATFAPTARAQPRPEDCPGCKDEIRRLRDAFRLLSLIAEELDRSRDSVKALEAKAAAPAGLSPAEDKQLPAQKKLVETLEKRHASQYEEMGRARKAWEACRAKNCPEVGDWGPERPKVPQAAKRKTCPACDGWAEELRRAEQSVNSYRALGEYWAKVLADFAADALAKPLAPDAKAWAERARTWRREAEAELRKAELWARATALQLARCEQELCTPAGQSTPPPADGETTKWRSPCPACKAEGEAERRASGRVSDASSWLRRVAGGAEEAKARKSLGEALASWDAALAALEACVQAKCTPPKETPGAATPPTGAGATIQPQIDLTEDLKPKPGEPPPPLDEPMFFERTDPIGHEQMLLLVPPAIGGEAVDEVRVELDRRTARDAEPAHLPDGWSARKSKNGVSFEGPPLHTAIALSLIFDDQPDFGAPVGLACFGSGRTLASFELSARPLQRAQRVTDLDTVLRLPHEMATGDLVTFRPLDPKFTPGGGTWTVGGEVARWNGDFDLPRYEFAVPAGFGAGRGDDWTVGVTYVDPWGTQLVDGSASGCRYVEQPSPPPVAPRLSGCSPQVLAGSPLCVCGSFPRDSVADLVIDGRPLAEFVVASSSHLLELLLPPDFGPGPFEIAAAAGSRFAGAARGELLRVGGEVDRNQLRRGQSTPVRLWLDGTTAPTKLRLWNTTPGIVSLEGGNDQVVTTSGGSPNQVSRRLDAVSPGDFELHYELTVGACPCADHAGLPPDEDEEVPEVPDDPEADNGPPQEQYFPPPGPLEGESYQGLLDTIAFWRDQAAGVPCRNATIDRMIAELERAIEALEESFGEMQEAVRDYLAREMQYSAYSKREQARRLAELERALEALKAQRDALGGLPPCDPYPNRPAGPPGEVIPPTIDLIGDLQPAEARQQAAYDPAVVSAYVHEATTALGELAGKTGEADCRDAAVEAAIDEALAEAKAIRAHLDAIAPKIEQLQLEIAVLPNDRSAAQRAEVDRFYELDRLAERLEDRALDLAMLPKCD